MVVTRGNIMMSITVLSVLRLDNQQSLGQRLLSLRPEKKMRK